MDYLYKTIRKDLKWELDKKMNLYFFGDVHAGTPACDDDRFDWFLTKASKDKDAYYVGMGDYFDFASTKERKALASPDIHDQTIDRFDDMVMKSGIEFAGRIKQMRGKLLGLIQGNHTWKLQNGKYIDEDLAERMETDYLGWLCVYALNFDMGNARTKTIYLILCHGQGGGKLIGTSVNKVDDLKRIFPFADIYATGHDHQRMAVPTTTLEPVLYRDKLRMKEHRQYLVKSGSFLKSYEPDKSQYTTRMLCRPADLGVVKLTISFHRDMKHGKDEIITDIESTV